jgi:hypothetical protein
MIKIPVTRLYWEEFLLFTRKNAEILMRHNAEALGKAPTELLKAIRENTLDVYIFDEAASSEVDIESMRCKHLVPSATSPSVLVPCRNPIVWSSTPGANNNLCVEHTISCGNNNFNNLPEARYIRLKSGEQAIVHDACIYTTKMELIGRYDKILNKSYLFKILSNN